MNRRRLAYCGVRGAYGQEENNLLRNVCLFVGGPVNCQRKECVVTFNDEDRSNSNSGEKAAQNPRCTYRLRQQRPRRHQHEGLCHYSSQGMGCLFCCENESMLVVLPVSITSNMRRSMSVETRMVVYCKVEPTELMESKKHGGNLPDVLVAEIDSVQFRRHSDKTFDFDRTR